MNRGIIEMVEVEMLVLSCKPGIQQAKLAFAKEGFSPKKSPMQRIPVRLVVRRATSTDIETTRSTRPQTENQLRRSHRHMPPNKDHTLHIGLSDYPERLASRPGFSKHKQHGDCQPCPTKTRNSMRSFKESASFSTKS